VRTHRRHCVSSREVGIEEQEHQGIEGGAEKEEHEREMRLSSLEEEEDNVKD
jgi:hypothetical protein